MNEPDLVGIFLEQLYVNLTSGIGECGIWTELEDWSFYKVLSGWISREEDLDRKGTKKISIVCMDGCFEFGKNNENFKSQRKKAK